MLSNGILETTTTTGTGALTTSAVSGRPRFTDKFPANATEASAGHFYYAILTQDPVPQFLESGIGYMSATGTLERIVVLSTYSSSTYSDAAPSAVNLPSGTKDVICTGEAGSAYGPAIPGIDTSVGSSVRYCYSAHYMSAQYGSTAALTVNRLYWQPFLWLGSRPIDGLFIRQSSVAGNFRIGLYECLRNGLIGRRIMGSTADTAFSGMTVVTTGGPQRCAPGWYYIGFVSDAAVSVNIASTVTAMQPNPLGHDGTQYYFSYAYVANGSTTMADPGTTYTNKLTANNAAYGVGVRTVA